MERSSEGRDFYLLLQATFLSLLAVSWLTRLLFRQRLAQGWEACVLITIFCCQFQSVETRTYKSKESKEICLQHYSNSYFSQDLKYVCLGFGKLKHNWHSNSAGGIKMILIRQVILRQLILQYCEVVLFDLRTSISMFHCQSDRIMSRVLTNIFPLNDFSGRVHIIVQ